MPKFVFWGTDEFAVTVLETLKNKGLRLQLIITAPDKPKGRKLIVTPPPAKLWAKENNISLLQPEKLDFEFCRRLSVVGCELFLVASYGRILPKKIINLPPHKTLNIHPSLLPRLRGPSPIQQTILREEKPGVTIIKMDEKMDHGPILAQKEIERANWPVASPKLSEALAKAGAELFAEILPKWLAGEIKEKPQDESQATYTQLTKKEDGLIDLKDDPRLNYRKFLAYHPWPGIYFFVQKKSVQPSETTKKIRVIVKEAKLENLPAQVGGKFKILRVLPEGKKEISFDEFLKNYRQNL